MVLWLLIGTHLRPSLELLRYRTSRCRTSQYRRTFVTLSVWLSNDLSDPVFDVVRQVSLKSKDNAFLLA